MQRVKSYANKIDKAVMDINADPQTLTISEESQGGYNPIKVRTLDSSDQEASIQRLKESRKSSLEQFDPKFDPNDSLYIPSRMGV